MCMNKMLGHFENHQIHPHHHYRHDCGGGVHKKLCHFENNHEQQSQYVIHITINNCHHHHHNEAGKAKANDWAMCNCKMPSHLQICLCLATKMDIGHNLY